MYLVSPYEPPAPCPASGIWSARNRKSPKLKSIHLTLLGWGDYEISSESHDGKIIAYLFFSPWCKMKTAALHKIYYYYHNDFVFRNVIACFEAICFNPCWKTKIWCNVIIKTDLQKCQSLGGIFSKNISSLTSCNDYRCYPFNLTNWKYYSGNSD